MVEKASRHASHTGDLHIGDIVIPCAVLDDGTRVISERGITTAVLGTRSGASKRRKRKSRDGGAPRPIFLAPTNLAPFISKELLAGPLNPLAYHVDQLTQGQRLRNLGPRSYIGFEANVLPAVCDIWLQARDAGALEDSQLDKAKKAEILMRSLAHVGIIALVDEATGYQEVRDREALQRILDKYLRKELAAWAKRFPDDFYQEMFRLRGWQWRGMKINRPSIVGHYTNDIIYARLAPGVLQELQERNPRDERGRRPAKHHQWLTEDIGHPRLQEHLTGVKAIMRGSTSWDNFMRMLQRSYPKINTNLDLPYADPDVN